MTWPPVARHRLVSLEIRGFRAFGAEARVLHLDSALVVVHAGNSQGKTSLAESIEFLISGRSSRRELLGGAKAEYNDSLRNAHLPDGDTNVYVQAVVRDPDGVTHQVRRELLTDFGQGAECASRLLLDGLEVQDLQSIGLGLADPPVRAPVLLQHTLRHVLSTEPKQRVGYFKALLSLTDLDRLRDRVKAARGRIETEQPGATLRLLETLSGTAAAPGVKNIHDLFKKPLTEATAREAIERILIEAGTAMLAHEASEQDGSTRPGFGATAGAVTVDELARAVGKLLESQREQSFPLSALAAEGPLTHSPPALALSTYSAALDASDQHAARLAPVLEALLAVGAYSDLDEAAQCPVCGTEHALTAERVSLLREHLRQTQVVNEAAASAARALADARRDLDELAADAERVLPSVTGWNSDQINRANDMLRELGVDPALLVSCLAAGQIVSGTVDSLKTAVTTARGSIDEAINVVASRGLLTEEMVDPYSQVTAAVAACALAGNRYAPEAAALRDAVDVASRDRLSIRGLSELSHVLERRTELVADLVAEAARQHAMKRIDAAEKALREAAGRVLDDRFEQMSDTITDWWTSIRPEELVGFGGIKRRAGGALYVNLIAALRAEAGGAPVERDALGVYSDSQLNALGLSIFLARSQLLGSCFVVLDDPIPGSDADHRLTFVQNTLGRLLDGGVQVVLTTFDNKLAEWTQANHDWRGLNAYELNLLDVAAGTEATQTSDAFSRFLLEAEENLNSPTPRGRRAACGSYRSADERLAKQIIATGRTLEGKSTSVDDVDTEASVLGSLVPLVNGYALDNAEKGQWRTFATVLNPGNHDDDVPSTTELKQVRGNLRKIAKNHRAHWPDGLLL